MSKLIFRDVTIINMLLIMKQNASTTVGRTVSIEIRLRRITNPKPFLTCGEVVRAKLSVHHNGNIL